MGSWTLNKKAIAHCIFRECPTQWYEGEYSTGRSLERRVKRHWRNAHDLTEGGGGDLDLRKEIFQ